MPYKEMYLRYRDENPTKRRKLIKKMAMEQDMTVEEVVEGIMPYIVAEKPKNRFGRSVYIVGNLRDPEPYKEAEKRFKTLNKRFTSLYSIKQFDEEDGYVLAMSNLRMCDTVYFLNGWADEPLAGKIRAQAIEQHKILCYQEYEV
jgi:hypothetical protein